MLCNRTYILRSSPDNPILLPLKGFAEFGVIYCHADMYIQEYYVKKVLNIESIYDFFVNISFHFAYNLGSVFSLCWLIGIHSLKLME